MSRLWFQENKDGVVFRVHVQPRSSRNRLLGRHGEALKISLTAPPVEGAANRLCREFVAELLGLSKSQVEVVAGLKSRLKTIQVETLSGAELLRRCEIAESLNGCTLMAEAPRRPKAGGNDN
ncbi:MAG TPA: YggU family protein [Proteobacteria bacterium]|nr:YggU family protein [Pseudomonadota bacterium]